MKLWGWWKKDKEATEPEQSPKLLEDLPPKFEDDVDSKEKMLQSLKPSLRRELSNIGVEDFKKVHEMPCFRRAMLTGLGVGLVSGGIMFTTRRSLPQASNWTMGGFVVGAVITWEQCRYQMRQGKMNMRAAQAAYRDSNAKNGTPSTTPKQ